MKMLKNRRENQKKQISFGIRNLSILEDKKLIRNTKKNIDDIFK